MAFQLSGIEPGPYPVPRNSDEAISHERESPVLAVDRRFELRQSLEVDLQVLQLPRVEGGGNPPQNVLLQIHKPSYDAAALAKYRGAFLYADDLGLRRFVPMGDPHGSVSTISLLYRLVERGVLTPADRDRDLVTLAVRSAAFIAPSKELLGTALRCSGELGRQGVIKVFGLLAAPSLTALNAAQILVQVVKAQVSAPIRLASTSEIVSLGLEAMSAGWPVRLCIQAMGEESSELLLLLPHVQQEVREASREFMARAVRTIAAPLGN